MEEIFCCVEFILFKLIPIQTQNMFLAYKIFFFTFH